LRDFLSRSGRVGRPSILFYHNSRQKGGSAAVVSPGSSAEAGIGVFLYPLTWSRGGMFPDGAARFLQPVAGRAVMIGAHVRHGEGRRCN
jgi:hypothetical protein